MRWRNTTEFLSHLTPRQRIATFDASALLGVCLACSGCTVGILELPNVPSTPTRVPQGNSGNAGFAQTSVPKATNTPTPSNTPKPTPTATPKPSPEQILTALLTSALQHDGRPTDGLKVGYEIGDENLDVQTKAKDHLIGDWIKVEIQEDAKTILRTLYRQWPASLGEKPAQVTFQAIGPTKDKYGNQSTGAWGRAVLYRSTAAKINLNNLTYRQCWDVYDITYWVVGL
jgi:hypothetical protein